MALCTHFIYDVFAIPFRTKQKKKGRGLRKLCDDKALEVLLKFEERKTKEQIKLSF